ncbi:MAG: response regulator [Synechococcales bacterium]|nr:response regulator [Synechococcales bacterium]
MQFDFTQNVRGDVLIVDDTPDNLRVLSMLLTRQGYGVRKALDGAMALASAQAAPPDLILLDIKMPKIDGYEVCQQLRDSPKTSKIPVIFISALDDVADKVKAFDAGGVDYITKPFQAAEVLARVENQLRLRRLQQYLMLQNEELARSNRELEQFASVVSHDLQQPLQSIIGFAKLVRLRYQGNLDDKLRSYITSIEEAGERMQKLTRDLLLYAKAGNQVTLNETVDCQRVLKQVALNLHEAIATRQATLTYDPLPTIKGNEMQLVQLFQNLISNAIKFVRPGVSPQVRVSVEQVEEGWQFGIHDNGIGIPPEHRTRIFEMFQRVDREDQQYSGNGIGLATCKKIVENHGGRIWAESQDGVGTTFHFIIKADPSEFF